MSALIEYAACRNPKCGRPLPAGDTPTGQEVRRDGLCHDKSTPTRAASCFGEFLYWIETVRFPGVSVHDLDQYLFGWNHAFGENPEFVLNPVLVDEWISTLA